MPPVAPNIKAVLLWVIALLRLIADSGKCERRRVPMELLNMAVQLYNYA
jgi:hypothetical protein